MKVCINIVTGPNHDEIVYKKDIQKNINALQRAIDGKPLANDFISMIDTQSILEQIKKQLPTNHL